MRVPVTKPKMSNFINIKGKSYRLKGKLKENEGNEIQKVN